MDFLHICSYLIEKYAFSIQGINLKWHNLPWLKMVSMNLESKHEMCGGGI